jgi:xanthine dehydrogenase accessory factor
VKLDVLHALNSERAARRAAVLVTDVKSGEQRLVRAVDVAKDPLKDALAKRLRMAKSGSQACARA